MTDMDFATKYRAYGRKYPSSYGNRFQDWIDEVITGPYDSFGNGSAMRVSPVAWFEKHEHRVMELAKRSAEVTHNHPEGIKGAQATAMAILWARSGVPRNRIRRDIEAQFEYDLSTSVDELRATYQYNETCQQTVPEAIVCFLEADGFEDAIRNSISIGGDSDTLAAITGSIAEGKWGVPEWIREEALGRLDAPMAETFEVFASEFFD
jgi:ADP-ribosyl-[dinitrogen reductase] hydrolase